MKYSKLIKIERNDIEDTTVVKETTTDVRVGIEKPTSLSVDNDVVNEIISIMKEYANNSVVNIAPQNIENTVLNDDEIAKVLSYLLYLQKEYFGDIPLSKELCKQFVWNIPKNVYDAFDKSLIREEPDILNPLLFFYIFCVDEPREMIEEYINIIHSIFESMCDDGNFDND